MPDDREIEAPISLLGLFPDSDDEEAAGGSPSPSARKSARFTNDSAEQTVNVASLDLRVRQFCFHSHNANRVWPGTFNLAEYYLDDGLPGDLGDLKGKRVLELGSATGLLAIRFAAAGVTDIVTSDVSETKAAEEDGGEDDTIETNIRHNFLLNGVSPVRHIQHTWGTGWDDDSEFDIVIASDILLYVAAYSALVKTLEELIGEGKGRTFIMSWNRRMDESKQFFEMMEAKGFHCLREPKCVFLFSR